ncbi:flavodoxin family protein [Haliovirga abyssi]|uniref:FMN reductase n=1 Tax=Haliovirga abyssi TaxID=2996794 RepID=A0AAU9DBC3_9FUSO|nr:flavodoxin family protein [Haliovirga abyssi]BDU49502.1 FMN reductase [Haliovirga abyssi]
MKIAIINGSPRSDENSGFIAKKANEYLEKLGAESSIINVNEVLKDLEFPFCTACTTPCIQKCENNSPKLKEAFDILRESQGVIMISPVYFGTVTGQLKAFWDLGRHLRNEKALYKKPGIAVAVGASRFGGQETTVRTMIDMMLIQGMSVTGDGFDDNLGHQGVCFQKKSSDDLEGVKSLERGTKRLLEILS